MTINYTITSILASPSSISLSTTFSTIPESQAEFVNTLRNMRTSAVYNFDSPPTYPLPFPNINQIGSPPYTISLASSVAFSVAQYGDSVYKIDSEFDDATGGNYYSSLSSYVLVTTAIDAGIPLMPQTTGRDIATYNAAVVIRQDIQYYFDAEDYTNTNIWITYLTNLISGVSAGGALVPLATLPATVTINTELADTTAVFPTAFGYYNVITNTLLSEEYPYTWAFAPNSAVSQNNNTTQTIVYPDGVYTDYVSVLCTFNDEGNYPALLNEGTAYLLVVTSIQSQVEIFQNNYNPNDPAQAALLVELNDAYALMLSLFAGGEYEATNEQIVIIRNLLEGVTVCSGLSASLVAGTTNQIVLSYATLPIGTFAGQTGTIINSLTGEEYVFTGFPANDTDTQLILNSNDLGAGVSFSDGVWQVTNTFEVDATFQCTTYALVLTNARCCVRKAQARSATCKTLTGRAEELSSWLETAADEFNYSAYSVSNGFIRKINAVCSSCGCGC
jgi:hypothetical protein